jgi:hypothetical protein
MALLFHLARSAGVRRKRLDVGAATRVSAGADRRRRLDAAR